MPGEPVNIMACLDAIKTAIVAMPDLGSETGSLFAKVAITPVVDAQRLHATGRFPFAAINDAGGELNPNNLRLVTRRVEVTVIVASARNTVTAEEGMKRLLQVGEAMTLHLTRAETPSIVTLHDSDVRAVETDNGVALLSKTYLYEIEYDIEATFGEEP